MFGVTTLSAKARIADEVARQSWWRLHLWLLPMALCLVLMVLVSAWAAHREALDRKALGQRLQDDATSVQAQFVSRLDLERARLRDVALRLLGEPDRETLDLKSLPEVIAGFDRLWNRLVWLDADLRVVSRADRTARPDGPSWTDGLRIQGRGQADHLQEPVPANAAHREGQLLARYELTDLLRSTDLAWLSGRYQVTFVSELGEVIATTGRADVQPQGQPMEWPLRAFSDTVLRLAPYQSPQAWYLDGGTQAMLVGLLGLGLAATLLLRREMQRVRQAEAVSRNEAGWRRAMEDSALVGLRARDPEGRVLYVNKTLCDMVGYRQEELVGLIPPLPFWPPESTDALMASNRNTLSGAAPPSGYETRWLHRDGHDLDVVIFESPLVDGEGRQIGWMGSIVDIGERKRLEDIERRQTEVLAQHARLNDLGLIASELAHELNQPLAVIAAYSAGLKGMLHPGSVVDDEVLSAIAAMERSAGKAGDIVNWIRRQGARAQPVREPCQLNALIDEVLNAKRLLKGLAATVQFEAAPSLPPVPADRVGIEQVLINLVRNASDAMDGRQVAPIIVVRTLMRSTTPEGPGRVLVSVSDNGPGLQGRTIDQLCAAFFTTKREGMGLGLGICRSIIEQHGGHLLASDRPEGGACFSFQLPVT